MPCIVNRFSDHLVSSAVAAGIDHFFCVPGAHIDPLLNAVVIQKDVIRPVHARHEQGAGFMALGYSLASGKAAALGVIPGPGLLNAATPIATARSLNAGMFVVVGQVKTSAKGRGLGVLHELPQQSEILRGLVDSHWVLDGNLEAANQLERAFGRLGHRPSTPVCVEITQEMMNTTAAWPASEITNSPGVQINDDLLEDCASLLAEASRPMIFVGGGAIHAADEVRELASILRSPVTAYRTGKGVMDEFSVLSQDLLGAHFFWPKCDVALGIGTRMQPALGRWGLDDNIKTIGINTEKMPIDEDNTFDVVVCADAKAAVRGICRALSGKHIRSTFTLKELGEAREKSHYRLRQLEPQFSFVQAVSDVVSAQGVVVDELTQVAYVAHLTYKVALPRKFLSCGRQGPLGWGIPTAIGARMATGLPVVLLSGDGGFMYNAQELSSSMLHSAPINVVLFNDGAFGNVLRSQKDRYGPGVVGAYLVNPDFRKFAESFGVRYSSARTPDQLRTKLEQAVCSGVSNIIEVPCGEMPTPWDHINLPTVRKGRSAAS